MLKYDLVFFEFEFNGWVDFVGIENEMVKFFGEVGVLYKKKKNYFVMVI